MRSTTKRKRFTPYRPPIDNVLVAAIENAAAAARIQPHEWVMLAIRSGLENKGNLPEGQEISDSERQVIGSDPSIVRRGEIRRRLARVRSNQRVVADAPEALLDEVEARP